jgi:hypothetical protein
MPEQRPRRPAAAVSVTEMARMVALSRERFYQLQKEGVFPSPVYDIVTRRPMYTEEQQQVCLEVRRRNCGVNGKVVLFYPARTAAVPVARQRTRRTGGVGRSATHAHLIEALVSLGLSDTTAQQVDEALRQTFPGGTAGVEQSEVIRAVFVRLRRLDSGDSVGR